jgi:hypothetical protein
MNIKKTRNAAKIKTNMVAVFTGRKSTKKGIDTIANPKLVAP